MQSWEPQLTPTERLWGLVLTLGTEAHEAFLNGDPEVDVKIGKYLQAQMEYDDFIAAQVALPFRVKKEE